MPKAKPVSLHPLSFDEALTMIMKAPPKHQEKRKASKSTKS